MTVVFPTRFLETEDLGNNFVRPLNTVSDRIDPLLTASYSYHQLFNADKIMPLPIYD